MEDIVNRLANSLERGVQALSTKGREAFSAIKTESEVDKIRDALAISVRRLGWKTYVLLRRGEVRIEALQADVAAIEHLFTYLTQLQDTIQQIQGQSSAAPAAEGICPSCRYPIKLGAQYCGHCGAALRGRPIAFRRCPACGVIWSDPVPVCPVCGHTFGPS